MTCVRTEKKKRIVSAAQDLPCVLLTGGTVLKGGAQVRYGLITARLGVPAHRLAREVTPSQNRPLMPGPYVLTGETQQFLEKG